MNIRSRAKPETFGFQIAPMVDILLVLLVFFIVTWNFALSENELDVKIPSASQSKEQQSYAGQVVVNIKPDGGIMVNRQALSDEQLLTRLSDLAKLYSDQAVILRGDKRIPYERVVQVLDLCRKANIWNVAFATSKPE